MLLVLPDNKKIEDAHTRIKDLLRSNRNFVTSKVARACAIVSTQIIENSNVRHNRVTKAEFISRFKEAGIKRSFGQAFNSEGHRMGDGDAYTAITARRTWKSSVPQDARTWISAWKWMGQWQSLPAPIAPPMNRALLSQLMPEIKLVVDPLDTPYMCLATAKWAAMLCDVLVVPDRAIDADQWTLYRPVARITWRHVTDITDWKVLPTEPCSPLALHLRRPGAFECKVHLRVTGPPVSLLPRSTR